MFQKNAFQPNALQVGGEAKKPTTAFQPDAFQPDALQGMAPGAGGGVEDHPATIAVTLDGISVSANGTAGHPGTIAVTLDGIAVSAAGTVGHTGTISVTLEGVAVSASGVVGHPVTIAVTLDGIVVTSSGTVGHPVTVAITLDAIAVDAAGVVGHEATIDATLDGITVQINGTTAPGIVEGGTHYIGGSDYWLRRIEDEAKPIPKKAIAIIRKEAEKQAVVAEYKPQAFKRAFAAVNYPYRERYEAVFREAFDAALSRLRKESEDDDEEALLMLL